jgi:UPF0755 protein
MIIKKLKSLIILAVIILLIAGAFFYFQNKVYYSHGLARELKAFAIDKGEDAVTVGKKMEEEKLISGKYYFVYYLWRKNLLHKLVAGEYEINPELSIPEISLIITRGEKKSGQVKITFPEGWENKNIKARIENNGLKTEEFDDLVKKPDYLREKYSYDFLSDIPKGVDLEGYLFPDTYLFSQDAGIEEIIKKMLDNFDRKLTPEMREEILRQNKTIHEIITMASVIEGEVKTEEDRKMVSGIFRNRLKNDQPLQSCATLAYILGENKKQYSYEDTRVPSPYNTYLNKGLPPGPIGNPGIVSIGAAIYPQDSDYNYFLSDPETGKTIFSKTIEEHNANKVKYGL